MSPLTSTTNGWNTTTTVLQVWLWYQITHKNWYAIKQKQQAKQKWSEIRQEKLRFFYFSCFDYFQTQPKVSETLNTENVVLFLIWEYVVTLYEYVGILRIFCGRNFFSYFFFCLPKHKVYFTLFFCVCKDVDRCLRILKRYFKIENFLN